MEVQTCALPISECLAKGRQVVIAATQRNIADAEPGIAQQRPAVIEPDGATMLGDSKATLFEQPVETGARTADRARNRVHGQTAIQIGKPSCSERLCH